MKHTWKPGNIVELVFFFVWIIHGFAARWRLDIARSSLSGGPPWWATFAGHQGAQCRATGEAATSKGPRQRGQPVAGSGRAASQGLLCSAKGITQPDCKDSGLAAHQTSLAHLSNGPALSRQVGQGGCVRGFRTREAGVWRLRLRDRRPSQKLPVGYVSSLRSLTNTAGAV